MLDIDLDLLRSAITAGFGEGASHTVDPASTHAELLPSTGGGSFNTVVQRLSNAAGSAPWSVVAKHLGVDPARADWDREAHVYADAAWLTNALPDGLAAPRLLASARSDDGVTLILEDLPTSGTLAVAELTTAARLLSEFNGADVDARSWWSTNFLRNEFHLLSDHPQRLAGTRVDPRHERLRQHLLSLIGQAPGLLATAETLHHGPAHLDAYSRNVMVDRHSGTIALVDWANAGSAPLGTDPATLFVLTLNYLDANVSSIAELEASIISAMNTGLLDAGADSAIDEATKGFHAVARLRHLAMMMNALPMAEREDPAVSAIVGNPLDEIIDQWLAVGDHLLSE